MLVQPQPPLHLTYCLNIHPGETWAENFEAIRSHALRVRDRVAAGKPGTGRGAGTHNQQSPNPDSS
jgi:hypothetical protein